MKISDILSRGRPSVSFEVFPPKKDTSFDPVKEAVERLSRQKPSFISVTYGAAGNAQANTVEIARFVESCGVTALAHLTCINSTREKIESEARALKESGIENILCLRGDVAESTSAKNHEFAHAAQLVETLGPYGFCLGGACYPECHPECEHIEEDIAHLAGKVAAGLSFVTTQMFFDNSQYFHFVDRLRNAGITVPVIPGLKPISSQRQIDLLPRSFHIDIPQALVSELRKTKTADEAYQVGIEWAVAQSRDLLAHGVPAIHYYTMAKTDNVCQIVKQCF